MVTLVIAGCCGRMGQAIARCALSQQGFRLAAVFEAPGHPAIERPYAELLGLPVPDGLRVGADARKAIGAGQVLIEFTSPDATVEHARLAQGMGKPMVIGTTGLSDVQQEALRSVSKAIPVLVSPNMSVGVNVLFELAALAAKRLGLGYDVEVVESHHRHKQDAPSGTAKRLAAVLVGARGCPADQIPIHAVRAGDIVGDHTVILAGAAERLELTHRAHSREVFAQGAVRAAQFIVAQPPGLYEMGDILIGGVRPPPGV